MEIKYLTIRDWMLQLGLSYTELVAFAIVWGFTKDGGVWFQSYASEIAKWMAVADKRPVLKAFASLVNKGLIEKQDRWENGVHYCDYRVAGGDALKALGVMLQEHQGGALNAPGVVHEKYRGGASKAPHNNINNIPKQAQNISLFSGKFARTGQIFDPMDFEEKSHFNLIPPRKICPIT